MSTTTRMRTEAVRQYGSLSRFAAAAGLHVSSVSQIATGRLRPYPAQVEKIVRTLDWKDDPDELFEGDGGNDDGSPA